MTEKRQNGNDDDLRQQLSIIIYDLYLLGTGITRWLDEHTPRARVNLYQAAGRMSDHAEVLCKMLSNGQDDLKVGGALG